MTTRAAATAPAEPPGPAVDAGPRLVLVAGNPNAGKSTLFNALTGGHAKVSNYPGVTVTRTAAYVEWPMLGRLEVVDLPGTYSLSARSRDEQVAVDAVLGRTSARPDVVVIVADATSLSRHLYFALEVIETGVPAVVALSMTDEAQGLGIAIDTEALAAGLGVDVIPVVAPRQEGLPQLRAAIARALVRGPRGAIDRGLLPDAADRDVAALAAHVGEAMPSLPASARRAYATWLLLSLDDAERDDLAGILPTLRSAAAATRARAAQAGRDLDQEIIAGRYARVDAIVAAAVRMPATPSDTWTDRIDAVLTHRVWGVLVFAVVMLGLFQALFSWSEPAIGAIEVVVTRVQDVVTGVMPAGPLRELVVDGVVAGVGNVIVFVPQIALLFLFIGVLEDVGYLARVAFVIDRLMGRIGLHGKSFVPMLSGFSCAVPAVLATRTLENRTDRLLTMMVLPLMSCSARLPIYVLVIATVFSTSSPPLFGIMSVGAAALFAMYMLSVVAALSAAAVLRRTVFRGPRPTMMLELPPYRRPVARVLLFSTWRQVRAFLEEAGTVILALTIVLWALLNYPRQPPQDVRPQAAASHVVIASSTSATPGADQPIEARTRGERLRNSIAGRIGHLMEPVIAPLGFDWRIGVGILGAFAAREVFVSTMGIVFDIDNADEQNQPLRDALRDARRADGSHLMTPLTGLSLMVFFVLACQCMSTLAVVQRESGSWTWPAFIFAYQSVLAYAGAFLVYQGGRLLGFA